MGRIERRVPEIHPEILRSRAARRGDQKAQSLIAERREATNRQRDDSGRPQFPSTRQAAASIPYLTARFCQSRR